MRPTQTLFLNPHPTRRAAGRETLHHLGRVREFQKGFDMGMRKLLLEPFNQESRNINFSLANNPGFPGDT